MFMYPAINPVAFTIGPVSIYWYGLMYLLGFMGTFGWCYKNRLKSPKAWTADTLMDLLFYIALGVIFGGTLGYLLFYDLAVLVTDPLRVLRFWEPGRSFHGGLLGVIIAVFIYAKGHHRNFWEITDFIAPSVPIAIATGRLGNFMNGELWGRVTEVPWGMIFPEAGNLPRHPSQLYELGLEGIALFIALNFFAKKERPRGAISGLFLVGYGVFRSCVEFFREPDFDQGYFFFGILTKGQLLSFPMVLVGGFMIYYAYRCQTKRR
jgi:phosphatidylglycerol:prolipoprotein diacylglycerol transferase